MHPAAVSDAGADPGLCVGDDGRRHVGRVEFVPAVYAHIEPLVQRMRPEDAETAALVAENATPQQLYALMLMRSEHAVAALVDGVPTAMWGASVDSFIVADKAHLWLLIADDIRRPAHMIARGAVPFVERMLACYGRLVTTVAWGHDRDQRWVRWLGFNRAPAEDMKIGGRTFLAYERR